MAFWGGGRFSGGGVSPAHDGLANNLFSGLPDGPLAAPPPAHTLYGVLSESLVDLGLQIVREGRSPMRLWEFSWHLGRRLGMPPMPLAELSDAVKATLASIDHARLRLLAPPTRGTGAGYVYDAADPDGWPVRASR